MEFVPTFLTLAEVFEIHKNQIELYGGMEGIRDISLLTAAIAMPEVTFGGKYLQGEGNILFEIQQDIFHIQLVPGNS